MLTVTAPETMNTDVLDIRGEIFARFVTRELKKNRPGCPAVLFATCREICSLMLCGSPASGARLLLRTEPALPRVQHVDF
jgi:hypothetical protein